MIRALEFYSDFVIGPTGPVSRSESLNNPAVRVIITQGKETIYQGYLFGKFPDTHSFEHEEIKLKLVDALKK